MKKCNICKKGFIREYDSYTEEYVTVGRLYVPCKTEQCDYCGTRFRSHEYLQLLYKLYDEALDKEIRNRYDVHDKSLWMTIEEFEADLKHKISSEQIIRFYRRVIYSVLEESGLLFLRESVKAYHRNEIGTIPFYPQYERTGYNPFFDNFSDWHKIQSGCHECEIGIMEKRSFADLNSLYLDSFRFHGHSLVCNHCGTNGVCYDEYCGFQDNVLAQETRAVNRKLKEIYKKQPELFVSKGTAMKELGVSSLHELKLKDKYLFHVFVNKRAHYLLESLKRYKNNFEAKFNLDEFVKSQNEEM